MSYDRHDYGRWQTWHRRLGYGLLAFLLAISVYFFSTAEWVGAGLTVALLAFVLWTLHRG